MLARDRATGYARRGDLEAIDSIAVPAADTLALHFARPQAGLPLVLAELPLLPMHRLRGITPSALRRDAFTYAPLGSGPYRVVSREPGRRWILERMPAFPARLGGVAATRTLVIAVVDEATTKVAGLVSGAVDIAGVNPATAALVRRDPTLRVLDYPTFFTNWLVFNPACVAVQDVRVRRAIALAVDRRRIVDAGVGGFGVPSAAPSADAAQDVAPADTVRADSLLDAAGWRRSVTGVRTRNGAALVITMLTVGSGDNPVEQLLQADLRSRGVDLRIATRDMGSLLASTRSNATDHCATYTGVAGDPARSQLAALFDPAAPGGALDLGARRPLNLGPAFAALRTLTDSTPRHAAWRAVFGILSDSVPATVIFHSRGVQGLTRRLQHVTIDLRGELFSAARWTLAPVSTP
jgi:peptide/nickel transport system substrate-binding protein